MNTEDSKRRLLAEEHRLQRGIDESLSDAAGRDTSVGDAADASVKDSAMDEEFGTADRDTARLDQVRDALRRIDDGTYGKCIVDGGPIDEQRLKAVPWTPYCRKHQELLEASNPPKTRTL